ncbi:MAG: hypothetical protein ACTSRZ_16335, partial [Promethearchaeota archaeon]
FVLEKIINMLESYIFKFFVGQIRSFKGHWVNFFASNNEPVHLFSLKIHNLKYYNGFFQGDYHFKYGYIIRNSDPEKEKLLKHLIHKGYKEINLASFESKNIDLENAWKIVGYKIIFSYPFTFEEEAYFLFRYFTFYNLFALWNNIVDFRINNANELGLESSELKWLERDKNIFKILGTLVRNFFYIEESNFPKNFYYKFNRRDLNKEIVNKIFIKFVFSKQYTLEKKLDFYYVNRINHFSTINKS